MTAELATSATGGANPGSFYMREGKEPGDEHAAVMIVARRAEALGTELRIAAERGVPLGAFPAVARHIYLAARSLSFCLNVEATLAASSLQADPTVPEPPASDAVRGHFVRAARNTAEAGGHVGDTQLTLRKLARQDNISAADAGRANRAGEDLETTADGLEERLRSARVLPTLPMITGHGYIGTEASRALIILSSACGRLRAIALDTSETRGASQETRTAASQVISMLDQARESFRLACTAAQSASGVLENAAEIIRNAPAGSPCPACRGARTSRPSSRSRFPGPPCKTCHGTGIDILALHAITGQ